MDLIEIDAASNTSVDDIRDLRDKINFSPSQGRYKVYIIDEVHMLSTAAFNALLKTLEEPPPHAIFILATTEIHKIPATVLSRCQRHEFRRIPLDIIIAHLKAKSEEEGIKVEEPVFTEIARQATGSLRDAISLLDQLTSTNEDVTLELAQNVLGTATSLRVTEIVDALFNKDTAQGLGQINLALDSGTDPRQLARQVVTYLRNVLLYKMGNDKQVEVSDEVKPRVFAHANLVSMPDLLRAIEAFNQAIEKEQANWHPGLGLELAFTTFLVDPKPIATSAEIPVAPMDREKTPAPSRRRETPASPPRETVTASLPPKESVPVASEPEDEPITQEETIQVSAEEESPNAGEKVSVTEKPKSEESPAQGEITLVEVNQSWRKIKAMVGRHNPRTEALLNTSKLSGMKENTLILGFSSETLKQMMEKEGNLNLASDILEEVFGRPMLIKCIVSTHQASALPADVKIEKDSMVDTATRDLGGTITKADPAEDEED
jgi:DNA polymerase-3 subunit gamma/tau